MKQVPVKSTGDTLSADEYSLCTSQESQNQVVNSDITLNQSDLNQLTESTNRIANNSLTYEDITGVASNNYQLSQTTQFLNTIITQYSQGMALFFSVVIANTGAVTLNVNGISAATLLNVDASPIIAGQLTPGVINYVKFVGSNFILSPFNATDLAFQAQLANQTGGTEGDRLVGHTGETVFNAINDRPTSAALASTSGAGLIGNLPVTIQPYTTVQAYQANTPRKIAAFSFTAGLNGTPIYGFDTGVVAGNNRIVTMSFSIASVLSKITVTGNTTSGGGGAAIFEARYLDESGGKSRIEILQRDTSLNPVEDAAVVEVTQYP